MKSITIDMKTDEAAVEAMARVKAKFTHIKTIMAFDESLIVEADEVTIAGIRKLLGS